jgi:hypothetical protein
LWLVNLSVVLQQLFEDKVSNDAATPNKLAMKLT